MGGFFLRGGERLGGGWWFLGLFDICYHDDFGIVVEISIELAATLTRLHFLSFHYYCRFIWFIVSSHSLSISKTHHAFIYLDWNHGGAARWRREWSGSTSAGTCHYSSARHETRLSAGEERRP